MSKANFVALITLVLATIVGAVLLSRLWPGESLDKIMLCVGGVGLALLFSARFFVRKA